MGSWGFGCDGMARCSMLLRYPLLLVRFRIDTGFLVLLLEVGRVEDDIVIPYFEHLEVLELAEEYFEQDRQKLDSFIAGAFGPCMLHKAIFTVASGLHYFLPPVRNN